MKKHVFVFLTSVLFAVMPILCISCSAPPVDTEYKIGVFDSGDFLKVEGEKLVNRRGETVVLRGTNVGGYLVIETWMTAFSSNSSLKGDHKTFTACFTERFGKNATLELWEYYRNNFLTEQDFIYFKQMGMNCIRLPFSYMNVDPLYNNVEEIPGQKFNFRLLDEFIQTAADYGIYTILDLHGAYGSQNGMDHSGELLPAEQVDLFTNQEKMRQNIDLWVALSKHYKDNPAVAAYGTMNEPGGKVGGSIGFTSKLQWNFFDELYFEMRLADPGHIIMFESCWEGENLPYTARYNWENVIYSFHSYSGSNDYGVNKEKTDFRVDGIVKMKFSDVHKHIGEFNCYANEESWKYTLGRFNQLGWSWNSWTYKLNVVNDGDYRGWGIVYTKAAGVVPETDSYDAIKEKWSRIKTTDPGMFMVTFDSGKTLFDIMKEMCTAE